MIKYLSKGYQSVYQLIEDLHFDPEKPEMHNMFISNMSQPYALEYDGEQWNRINRDDIVNQLFDYKACYLNSMFKELKGTLNKKTIKKYSRFMNEPDKETIDGLKHEIKMLLYNKRNIPMKTKKHNDAINKAK